MATQLFLRAGAEVAAPNLSTDNDYLLVTARGVGETIAAATPTVAGPTNGVQLPLTPISWWYRVNAVTISGAITKNLWGFESAMNANAGLQVIIDRCDGSGAFISTVQNSEHGTELATSSAVRNWATGTVTSTTFADGDYIRLRVYANDVGTMASGYTVTISMNGSTAGASGDSYVTFTETITEYVPAADRVRPISTILQAVNRASSWCRRGRLVVPDHRLWRPAH